MTPRQVVLLSALLAGAGMGTHCGKARVCTQFTEPAFYAPPASPAPAIAVPTFHGDRARTGWFAAETTLTPATVGGGAFGAVWSSAELDEETVDGTAYAPHLYGSPLYADGITLRAGAYAGRTLSVIVVGSTNGWAYAVNAFTTPDAPSIPAGTILWRTRLAPPARVSFDGGLPLGVLSTPVLDLAQKRLYVASLDVASGWNAFALDLETGAPVPGWPVTLDRAAVAALDVNGPALFDDAKVVSQRGALNLSPDGGLLYVPFGAYNDGGIGWLVVVDTRAAKLSTAFSSARSMVHEASGGMWGAGGPSIDPAGNVYDTTGNSPDGSGSTPATWGNSLLRFGPGAPLALAGSYTPWDYCQLDTADVDVGGSSPLVLPDLDPAATATPHLLAFGSKQGTVYLLDRDALAASDRRPACSTDPSVDTSLRAPAPQPQPGARGPLSVFGPYSEQSGNGDFAKMRSTPAYFRDGAGTSFLFVSGSTKVALNATADKPPSLARLRVATSPGAPAYLAIDAVDAERAFKNPGAPVVTSNGASDAIVWVLDPNGQRTDSMVGCDAPAGILYAVDATTMRLLWKSGPGELHVGGKYTTPVVAHGVVFAGTDRVQAFGLRN